MANEIRVRYAPSPTGFLHIGNARTALFNYLFARSKGGKFIIRIEDTDQKRNVEGGVESQLKYLKWLGIDWDESIDVGGEYGLTASRNASIFIKNIMKSCLTAGWLINAIVRKKNWKPNVKPSLHAGKCRVIPGNAAI